MIPKLHYISQGNSLKEHLENIQKACSAGAELVQLRLNDIPSYSAGRSEKKFLKLASEAREITAHFQTRLLINNDYRIAKVVKADGVHLEKTGSCPTLVRKDLHTWQIIGGTANTLQYCQTLIHKEVDYISLGPFKSSITLENVPVVLGLNGFTAIIDILKTETPIIGFGGITTEDVAAILETGISGIAVATEITRDFNNIALFNQLLNTSSTKEQRYTFE